MRGGERQLLYLACALRARGHENIVACRAGCPLEQEAARLGLATLTLPYLCELDLVSALKARAAARRLKAPILHAHTAHAAGIAALAGALGGPPAVAHRRVDFPLSGGLSARFKYGRAAAVIAVSDAIAGIMAKDGVPPAAISVVRDAIPADAEECAWAQVPTDRFAPASPAEKAGARAELARALGAPAGGPWIGNMAALVPHKDHDTLLSAAWIVLKSKPQAAFVIAGEGPEQERLIAQVARLGLKGKVFIAGAQDPSRLLKSLDVYAHSSWGEGMGSVLLEASACGLPIAATDAGGIPEIVVSGATGLLCRPRDPEALAANILKLLNEPGPAALMAEAARARIARFGLKRLAEQTEEVYDRAYAL